MSASTASRALLGVLLGAISIAACAGSPAGASRPPCADRVALAFTSPKPISGAYACMVVDNAQSLQAAGIASDDQWAAANHASPHHEPFVYETRLLDGAYVYREDIVVGGKKISIDLVLWLAPEGYVVNFAVISAL